MKQKVPGMGRSCFSWCPRRSGHRGDISATAWMTRSQPWEDLGLSHPAEGITNANVLRLNPDLSIWIQPYLKQALLTDMKEIVLFF